MKKETLADQIGYAYFCLTIIATLFMSYLKAVGDITFSWWWVFSPVWVSLALGIVLAIIVTIGANQIIKNEKTTYKD